MNYLALLVTTNLVLSDCSQYKSLCMKSLYQSHAIIDLKYHQFPVKCYGMKPKVRMKSKIPLVLAMSFIFSMPTTHEKVKLKMSFISHIQLMVSRRICKSILNILCISILNNLKLFRYKKLSFTSKNSAVIHGFAGFFETQLYDKVWLSIKPQTHTPDMRSW